MKIQWKELLTCLAIPLAVGGVASFLTKDNMQIFQMVEKPPLAPPGWLFPVAWTILYVLMGLASYLVLNSGGSEEDIKQALGVYGVQLIFNFLWPIFFFNLQAFWFSFAWLVALEVLILATAYLFGKLNKYAGYLMVPYALWVAFAGYLNAGIALLN